MEIVPAADKRAQLRSLGAPGGKSPQAGAARIIVVVAAVNGAVEIDPMVEPGRVQPAATTIDVDMTARVERRPGMRIPAHHADGQLIGDAVIDAEADSAGREVVPFAFPSPSTLTKSPNPVTHTPQRFSGAALEDRFHDRFGGLAVRVGSILQIHRGAVDLHVGSESVRSVSDIVQPVFQVQSLNIRVGKTDFVNCRQTIR